MMRTAKHFTGVLCVLTALCSFASAQEAAPPQTAGGWVKYENNPVILYSEYGTIFDVTMIKDDDLYKMWLSWRPKRSIAYTESKDGINWSELKVVLTPEGHNWADDLNRPAVLKKEDTYHMWYTGQARGQTSKMGYATSKDGLAWEVQSSTPVMVSEEPWEKVAVMCPHVEWDADEKLYKMWYSAGEQYEPNSIGYATSPDGITWTKHKDNPIFIADPESTWEKHKVTACQIIKMDDWYTMFYIGFENEDLARIGLARSRDGITGWQRHPANPIISPGPVAGRRGGPGGDRGAAAWDGDACYKPFALYSPEEDKWRLWYNGRRGGAEQIGMAYYEGEDLGFPEPDKSKLTILNPENYQGYIEQFNKDDNELYRQFIPNEKAWEFLRENIPFFDYPDKEIERTYYFRWWTFRKHIKKTDSGFVITEFLPAVPWAGKENTISCAGGHHFREGRWLHDRRYLNDYAMFWLRGGGAVRSYSFWIADSLWQQYLVTGDLTLAKELLPDLIANYEAWERERLDPNGLFWQIDDRDGMEVSIGGSGYRATINSYMFGEALAITWFAQIMEDHEKGGQALLKAIRFQELINDKLWDDDAKFYKVAPRVKDPAAPLRLADVRELHGFTPWYVADGRMPRPEYRVAWAQLMDPQGFYAPFGPTTAERRHPGFRISYEGHECQWNGPSWPYSTSITLTALANLINQEKFRDAEADVEDLRKAYVETFRIYANSHRIEIEEGKTIPWIDENLNPQTGDWISRTRLKTWRNGTWDAGKGGVERGKDYNHSTFCDLVINGLIGFRPTSLVNTGLIGIRPTQQDWFWFSVFPLVPKDIEYFCLDGIKHQGGYVTIVYDKTGERYGVGKGLRVYVDGEEVYAADELPTVPVEVVSTGQ